MGFTTNSVSGPEILKYGYYHPHSPGSVFTDLTIQRETSRWVAIAEVTVYEVVQRVLINFVWINNVIYTIILMHNLLQLITTY